MADEAVRQVQKWLNTNYNFGIEEDGYTGYITVTALIKALQIELGFPSDELDGSFGPGTTERFNTMFPNGLNAESAPVDKNKKHIIYILRGGMYCRGIDGGDISGGEESYKFTVTLDLAVQKMKSQLGIENPTPLTMAREMKAVLTTDAYIVVGNGTPEVRTIQQALNRKYLEALKDYLPTNGLYDRYTNVAIKKAIQFEIGVTPDGSWGSATKNALPALTIGSTRTNLVYLLQYLLYLNGFDPNGFDGSFGNGARTAVINFQTLMCLEVDGSVGPQTWFALVLSCGDTSRSANACDTRFEITAERAKVLKSDGYDVVGRYINGGEFKELKDNELQTIFNANLKVFFIYQENNRSVSDFGYTNGYYAGIRASRCARKHHLPNNVIIYFAVDLDVYEEQISEYIIPYFEGVKGALDTNFRIGIYGPRKVCSEVSKAGLSISSFVADMSSGYSCNIGAKMPSDWCYDQFTEISGYNDSFDLDKVTYRGNIPACDSLNNDSDLDYSLAENQDVLNYLTSLYNYATEYCTQIRNDNFKDSSTITYRNSLVLQYLREISYNGPIWASVTGEILDPDWLKFIKSKFEIDSREDKFLYISKLNKIGLIHLAVTTESNLINSNTRPNNSITDAIKDLSGWAGDLLSFAAELNSEYSNACKLEDIINKLGTNKSARFNEEDLLQDIDAINTYKALNEKPIYDVYKEYYDTNSSRTRFTKFITYFRERGNFPSEVSSSSSDYDILYYTAYKYLNRRDDALIGIIDSIFGMAFDRIFGNYDVNTWAELVAQAFATKMLNLSHAETD